MLSNVQKRIGVLIALLCLLAVPAAAWVENFWPLYVAEEGSAFGRPDYQSSLGPFIAGIEDGERSVVALRPLWVRIGRDSGTLQAHLLYPVANWHQRPGVQYGHVLNLLRYRADERTKLLQFEVFPFFFYKDGDAVAQRTLALWPLAGVLHQRLWRDEIAFAAWPLWVRTKVGDETRVHFPYPFLRYHYGPRSSGFGIWPLFGRFQRVDDYRRWWALWPLLYSSADQLDREQPRIRYGFWPLYHHERAAGMHAHGFVWPFFGWTREYEPRVSYEENRYFYPFIVQGRGEERYINRLLPLYADERRENYRKQWLLWPLLKREQRSIGVVEQDVRSLLYFVVRDERQQLGPERHARLSTVWPLFGYWNDGDGRKQLQALDPLTVFFPRNEAVKQAWSPLFAVYRWDRRGVSSRHSLLWDLVVYEHIEDVGRSFTFGPLLEVRSGEDAGWSLLKGLVGSEVDDTGERRLQLFWRSL